MKVLSIAMTNEMRQEIARLAAADQRKLGPWVKVQLWKIIEDSKRSPAMPARSEKSSAA